MHATPFAPEVDDAYVVKQLAELPQELREQLTRAALEANRQKSAQVVGLIREQDVELASALEKWLARFRFDKIVSLLEKQERQE